MYELLVDAPVMPRRIRGFLPFIFASNAPFPPANKQDRRRKKKKKERRQASRMISAPRLPSECKLHNDTQLLITPEEDRVTLGTSACRCTRKLSLLTNNKCHFETRACGMRMTRKKRRGVSRKHNCSTKLQSREAMFTFTRIAMIVSFHRTLREKISTDKKKYLFAARTIYLLILY